MLGAAFVADSPFHNKLHHTPRSAPLPNKTPLRSTRTNLVAASAAWPGPTIRWLLQQVWLWELKSLASFIMASDEFDPAELEQAKANSLDPRYNQLVSVLSSVLCRSPRACTALCGCYIPTTTTTAAAAVAPLLHGCHSCWGLLLAHNTAASTTRLLLLLLLLLPLLAPQPQPAIGGPSCHYS